MMVSHHDHHRHSAYVLAHADAPGFSQSQQRRLADLVLAQRGGLRKVDAALARDDFAWQVMCLRLAIIACHARADIEPGALQLRRSGGVATLAMPAAWAETHPRTLHLLREEVSAWERGGPLQLVLRG
jgi:exopolyphosphatase / guanosine-5'-triphosphate,3'-diphosphate pyrophosphatase